MAEFRSNQAQKELRNYQKARQKEAQLKRLEDEQAAYLFQKQQEERAKELGKMRLKRRSTIKRRTTVVIQDVDIAAIKPKSKS